MGEQQIAGGPKYIHLALAEDLSTFPTHVKSER